MACGIYIIKNKINNKIYIGQGVNISDRFYDHKRGYGIEHNSAIDLAIQKYGVKNFTFEILKECDRQDLNYWENYYANLYNSYVPNGYNINKCGEAFHNSMSDKEVSCYDLKTGILIETFSSLHEAERQKKYNHNMISNAIRQNKRSKTAYGMYWAWGHNPSIIIDEHKPLAGQHGGKTVYQYDLNNGNLLNSFNSLAEAERYLNIKGANKNLSAVCLGKRNYAYGYKWSYTLYNNINEGV